MIKNYLLKNIAYTLLFILFNACTTFESPTENAVSIQKNNLEKTWLLSQVEPLGGEGFTSDLMKEAVQNAMVEKGHLLSFFPDNTFAEIAGLKYTEGTWEMINNSQIARISNHTFPKLSIIKDTLKLTDYSSIKNKQYISFDYSELASNCKFLESFDMLNQYHSDPFHPSNNKWRKKAHRLENEKQLKERLQNYVAHNAFILKASMERDQNIVSFQFSEGIIKIYRGGIGVVKSDEIPSSWSLNFFNEEQAEQTRQLFGEYLKAVNFKGATSGSWVRDDYNILISIFKKIQESIEQE